MWSVGDDAEMARLSDDSRGSDESKDSDDRSGCAAGGSCDSDRQLVTADPSSDQEDCHGEHLSLPSSH
jgi:hypothetical protein